MTALQTLADMPFLGKLLVAAVLGYMLMRLLSPPSKDEWQGVTKDGDVVHRHQTGVVIAYYFRQYRTRLHDRRFADVLEITPIANPEPSDIIALGFAWKASPHFGKREYVPLPENDFEFMPISWDIKQLLRRIVADKIAADEVEFSQSMAEDRNP